MLCSLSCQTDKNQYTIYANSIFSVYFSKAFEGVNFMALLFMGIPGISSLSEHDLLS